MVGRNQKRTRPRLRRQAFPKKARRDKELQQKNVINDSASDEEAEVEIVEAKRHDDNERVRALISDALRSDHGPSSGLLTAVRDVVTANDAQKLIETFPSVPRLLLLSVQRQCAIRPEDATSTSASLVALACAKSAEGEAVQRASNWALRVITDAVRGEKRSANGVRLGIAAHGYSSPVSVCPRDTLDGIVIKQMVKGVVEATRDGGCTGKDVLHACELLRPLFGCTDVVPAIQAVVLAAARQPVVIEAGSDDPAASKGPLPKEFVRDLIEKRENGVYDALNVHSQATVLYLSEDAFVFERQRIESMMERQVWIPFHVEKAETQALGRAGAIDVHLHWLLLDSVEDTISEEGSRARSLPAAVPGYRAKRCLLSAIYRAVQESSNEKRDLPRKGPAITSFPQRFPRALRGAISSISALSLSAWRSKQTSELCGKLLRDLLDQSRMPIARAKHSASLLGVMPALETLAVLQGTQFTVEKAQESLGEDGASLGPFAIAGAIAAGAHVSPRVLKDIARDASAASNTVRALAIAESYAQWADSGNIRRVATELLEVCQKACKRAEERELIDAALTWWRDL